MPPHGEDPPGPGAAYETGPVRVPAVGRRLDWRVWPAVAAGLALVLVAMMVGGVGQPWRPVAALLFLAVGPGAALVPLCGVPDLGMELTLVPSVSFALVSLSSAALFYSGVWSADRELAVMLALCLAGIGLQIIEARQRRRAVW
jgi:hypothetical protein